MTLKRIDEGLCDGTETQDKCLNGWVNILHGNGCAGINFRLPVFEKMYNKESYHENLEAERQEAAAQKKQKVLNK